MKTKAIFFAVFAITLFSLGTTITLLFNSTPQSSDIVLFFFTSLLITLFGLFFFASLFWSFMRSRGVPAWQTTLTSGRYSLLLATFFVLALLLRSFRLWNIATGLVLLAAFIALELLWRRRAARRITG